MTTTDTDRKYIFPPSPADVAHLGPDMDVTALLTSSVLGKYVDEWEVIGVTREDDAGNLWLGGHIIRHSNGYPSKELCHIYSPLPPAPAQFPNGQVRREPNHGWIIVRDDTACANYPWKLAYGNGTMAESMAYDDKHVRH